MSHSFCRLISVGGNLALNGRGLQRGKFTKCPLPFARVLFCGDRSVRLAIKGEDVLAQFACQTAEMMFGEVIQELGVGLVGEEVSAGFDGPPSIQVLVGQYQAAFAKRRQVGFISRDRNVKSLDKQILNLDGWRLELERSQRAYLWQDLDDEYKGP